MSSYMIVDSNECSNNSCSSQQGYFQIKNLFSELKTEADKANARQNLGIGDTWNIKWGNITGFIEKQTDLTQYLDTFVTELRDLVNPFNQPYTNSDNPSISTVGEALDQLLYKELTIQSTVTPNIAEIGETVPEVKFSWKYNKNVTQQSFDGTDIGLDIREVALQDVTSTTSKSLQAFDGENTKKVVMSITFKLASYYGVSESTPTNSEEIISRFTRDLNFYKGSSVTITAQDNQYIYLMLPKSMGQVQFYVGGFEGGFQIVDPNFQFTKNGVTNSYILYKSDNPGLGTTTINTK